MTTHDCGNANVQVEARTPQQHLRFPERGYWCLGCPHCEYEPVAPGSCEAAHWPRTAAGCTCSPCLDRNNTIVWSQLYREMCALNVYLLSCTIDIRQERTVADLPSLFSCRIMSWHSPCRNCRWSGHHPLLTFVDDFGVGAGVQVLPTSHFFIFQSPQNLEENEEGEKKKGPNKIRYTFGLMSRPLNQI